MERKLAPTLERTKLAYDPKLDIEEYKKLSGLEGQIPPQEYAELLLRWRSEKIVNLETNIGERFNAQLFEVNYPVQNGRLVNPFRDEFALDMIVNGQQHRLANPVTHDEKRELAEIISFSAAENFFAENPKSQEKLIIPSPPGGSYGANFIDVYDLNPADKKQQVRMRRFAISSQLNEHWNIAQELTGGALEEPIAGEIDIQLKEIVIRTPKTVGQILKSYIPDEEALTLNEYQKLKGAYAPWAANYVEKVMAKAGQYEITQTYYAGLKFADIYMGRDMDQTQTIAPRSSFTPQQIPYLVHILGSQPIREVKTGCGSSGKTDTISQSLFGSPLLTTPEFLRLINGDDEEVVDFQCPGTKKDGSRCTYIVKAYSHVAKCPECGENATCAA